MTFSLPPNLLNLASASPKVLDTDNLPGSTRYGPTRSWLFGWAPKQKFFAIVWVLCNQRKLLVNFTTILNDPFRFPFFIWLMVDCQGWEFFSTIPGNDCSRVSNISHIAYIVHYQGYYSTWTRFINEFSFKIIQWMIIYKLLFSSFKAFLNSLFDICREFRIFNNVIV